MPWHWGWISILSKHAGSRAAARFFYHSPAIPRIVSRVNYTCVPSFAMPWNERSRWSIRGMVNVLINCYLVTDIWFLFYVSSRMLVAWFASAILSECWWKFPSTLYLFCWRIIQVWISITAYLHFICQLSQDKNSLAERIGEWDFFISISKLSSYINVTTAATKLAPVLMRDDPRSPTLPISPKGKTRFLLYFIS